MGMVISFPIVLSSTSVVFFPRISTSNFLTSCYFPVIDTNFLSFIVSLSGGSILTGDPVSTMKSFFVPSAFVVMVVGFRQAVTCFISAIKLIDLSVSLPSVSSSSVICIFLLFPVVIPASPHKVPLVFEVLTCCFSGWATVFGVPICCTAKSAISFFWSLSWSCFVFFSACCFVYRFLFDLFLSVWY